MTFSDFLTGLMGPYGVIVLGAGIALAFYLRLIVPGSWWRSERAGRLRAEGRVHRLLLVVGKATGANEVFLEALREGAPDPGTGESL